MTDPLLSADTIAQACQAVRPHIIHTPVVDLKQDAFLDHLPEGATVRIKLELLQKAGSFKARGAYLSINALNEEEKKRGVVAASGGNHALAVAWAAKAAGISAKVAVPKTIDPFRLQGCEALGAEIVLCDHIGEVFPTMQAIEKAEGRAPIHPFEGPGMALGSATCGQELFDAYRDVEVVILPVGGGGLIAGMSAALKLANPTIEIFGVEPFGADTLYRSFKTGEPKAIDTVNTIADSLGSPTALPYSFSLARANVSDIVRVSDDELRNAMKLLQQGLKIIPEPACAASLAGLIGPLKKTCQDRKVAIIACGSNIGLERYQSILG